MVGFDPEWMSLRQIRNRRSVRSYLPRAVPDEMLDIILEAGRTAPSASNRQPWHFIIVKDASKREILAKGGLYAKFLVESPVVIVGCGDREASPKWYVVDTTIALQSMVLAAIGGGLGTCWVGSFTEAAVKELLRIPDNYAVVALIALGYSKESKGLDSKAIHQQAAGIFRNRKKMGEVASLDKFETPYGHS